MYIPVPITLQLIPDIALISDRSPPRIVSAVTAVCASNGVGSGLIKPSPLLLTVALTCVVSISSTRIVYVALPPPDAPPDAESKVTVTVSPTCQPSPPCNNTTSRW